ncbi:MAG: GNAT family N-acetyltransferase [Kouleothrix sp.]|jgi:GNAT superfamily N-acetyltransferase|nr:GNAT family N-acetyltransferase [Kouleothrix sp.]
MSEAQQGWAFRRAGPGDVAVIAAITDAAYSMYVPRLGRQPQPMTADYTQIVVEHPVWLLTAAGAPAGVLVLMREPEALLIYSVALEPRYQGRGLGRELLAWAEHEARAAGYARIRLFTNALMHENIARYNHLGYRETHREPFHELTIVHFAKAVAPRASEEG